ncbi:PREDICTED: LOW QUALITY PROTEIN: mechanosensory protein 2-like [Trachymyrmex cornetzi]|uniref:LOW QUALITY PROTEIN: mechanosensory protein 2-like n=1 Tax=Trachymyrmex cornetzi TaxID=471704 RepID=UPI00084ED909|nr:PREDICTED: LOW QUALITY PROTEIN: mechanosensory protein 2-like [Trachymyrmex cornetzi]
MSPGFIFTTGQIPAHSSLHIEDKKERAGEGEELIPQLLLDSMAVLRITTPQQEVLYQRLHNVVDTIVYYIYIKELLNVKIANYRYGRQYQSVVYSCSEIKREEERQSEKILERRTLDFSIYLTVHKTSTDKLLSEWEIISYIMQITLDKATDPWGIKVELKDVRLPVQFQRAMAMEAEATRKAIRAKVITAEGEMRASHFLKEASDVISTSPAALQVRSAHIRTGIFCDTLNNICSKRNSTVIFLLPVEFLKPLFISDLCAH